MLYRGHNMNNTSTRLNELFNSLPNLPTIPKVVTSILKALEDPNQNLDNLVSEVSKDQVLAAKVLRLANSSFYAASFKISTIDKAVSIVGTNSLKSIVLTSFMTNTFKEVPNFELDLFWGTSLMAGYIAKDLAGFADLDPNVAFTAGLVHKIGVLLLVLAYPDKYALVHDKAGCVPEDKVKAEFEYIGISHCQAGAELAERWGFPWVLTDAIKDYAMGFDLTHCKVASLVYIASVVAKGVVLKKSPEMVLDIISSKNVDLLSFIKHTPESFIGMYKKYEEQRSSIMNLVS